MIWRRFKAFLVSVLKIIHNLYMVNTLFKWNLSFRDKVFNTQHLSIFSVHRKFLVKFLQQVIKLDFYNSVIFLGLSLTRSFSVFIGIEAKQLSSVLRRELAVLARRTPADDMLLVLSFFRLRAAWRDGLIRFRNKLTDNYGWKVSWASLTANWVCIQKREDIFKTKNLQPIIENLSKYITVGMPKSYIIIIHN